MLDVRSITWDVLKEEKIIYNTTGDQVAIKELINYINNNKVNRDKKDILTDLLKLCGLTVTRIIAPDSTSIMFQNEPSGKYDFLQLVLDTNSFMTCTAIPEHGVVYFKPMQSSTTSYTKNCVISKHAVTLYGATTYSFGYVSICMYENSSYMFQNSLTNHYYVGTANTNKTKHEKAITLSDIKQSSSNEWNNIIDPPNFGILDKNIQGVSSILAKESDNKMFGYTKEYLDIKDPYMWNLNNNSLFICYSNFDGSDNWGTTSSFSSGGYAEQPYYIDSRGLGRDAVKKSPIDNWWNQSSYSEVVSKETDHDKTHNMISDDGYYWWNQKTQFNKQTKQIKTYEESDAILIVRYNKTKNELYIEKGRSSYKYSLDNYKKILVAKRDLISLQEKFDTRKHTRFMMCYGDSSNAGGDINNIAHILAIHSGGTPNINYLNYDPSIIGAENKEIVEKRNDNYYIGLVGTAGYFNFTNTYNNFSEAEYKKGPIESEIEIRLDDIQYYDITELLKEKQELAFPHDLTLLSEQPREDNNINLTDIENKLESKEYVFNFGIKIDDENKAVTYYNRLRCCWHGGVTYKIKVDNIKTLGIPQIQDNINHIQNIQTANLEYPIYNDNTKSTISSSVLVQDYCSWTRIPNWFTEHFVNLGCNSIGIVCTYNNTPFQYRSVNSDKVISQTIKVKDPNHEEFLCTANVTGWADWKYDNLIPASTALQVGNDNSNSPTWYAHCVQYWSPYKDDSVELGTFMTGRGLQLGLTAGIAINYPDINSVDPTYYRIIDNKMPSIGILISK